MDKKKNLVGQAYFYHFWISLSIILPARAVASILVRKHSGCNFKVVASIDEVQILTGWRNHELLEIYVAHELMRKGQKVEIFKDKDTRLTEVLIRPSFVMENFYIFSRNGVGFCPVGIRNPERVMNKIFSKRWTFGRRVNIQGSNTNRKYEVFNFLNNTVVTKKQEKIIVHPNSIYQFLIHSLSEYQHNFEELIKKFLSKTEIKDLHICQHPFLESISLAEFVVNTGGEITLWPHSINNSQMLSGFEFNPKTIIQVVEQPNHPLNKSMPKRLFLTQSDIALPRNSKPPILDSSGPLNIIIIATAHSQGETYVLDYNRHIETYAAIFSGLQNKSSFLNVYVKPRNAYEDIEWFKKNFDHPINFLNSLPMDSGLKNKVFINITLASSTIYEGIANGIPSIVVKDQDINDYTPFDPLRVPVCNVTEALSLVERLNERHFLSNFYADQLNWYREVTNFRSIESVSPLKCKLQKFSREVFYLSERGFGKLLRKLPF